MYNDNDNTTSSKEIKNHDEELKRLKGMVEEWFEAFHDNIKAYHDFRRFVFVKQLTDVEEQRLASIGKSPLQFNIIEPCQSRLRGEWSRQEPTLYVGVKDFLKDSQEYAQLVKTAEILEGHIRYILQEANNNGCSYDVFTEQISGGYSAYKYWTEYEDSMSLYQVIKVGKSFDPTMTGYDLLARDSHKGDGKCSFEIYPKTKQDFQREYPGVDISEVSFAKTSALGGFEWSFCNKKADVLLMCDFYEKKKRKVEIVQLADERVMTKKEYKKALKDWEAQKMLMQPPVVKASRTTELITICRWVFIENKILSYDETDYEELPLVFVDNNSAPIRDTPDGATKQVTRPFFYNAKDIQRLKNFAGQTLACDIENMVQQKWKISLESIHNDWQDWIKYPQIPAPVVYNAFMDGDPDKPCPAPMEVQRTSSPPEVMAAFMAADQTLQAVLGSYAAAMGDNENDLSGKAILASATQSNTASMPSIACHIQSMNQLGKGILKLIPKVMFNRKSIPVLSKTGEKQYVNVNGEGEAKLDYDPHKFDLTIEAGVNFEIEKARTIDWIVKLAQAMPTFGQFMNEKGLDVIVNNLPLKGSDQLYVLAQEYKKELAQQKQMAQQMAAQQAQQNPAMMKVQLEQAKLQHQAQQDQMKNQIDSNQQLLDEYKAETERMKARMQEAEAHMKALATADKAQAEEIRSHADTTIALVKEANKHHSDMRGHEREDAKLHHDMKHTNKPETK